MKQMRRAARRIGAAAFTLLALLALTLGLFLLPPVVHLLLDLADAAEILNVAAPVAHSLSDALVRDLLVGGAFDVPLSGEPLLSASERSHLVVRHLHGHVGQRPLPTPPLWIPLDDRDDQFRSQPQRKRARKMLDQHPAEAFH